MAHSAAGARSRSDLFLFDRTALKGDILLHDGRSNLEYHEYAVFKAPDKVAESLPPESAPDRSFSTRHVSHSIGPDHPSSDRLFDLALKQGHGLNSQVCQHPSALFATMC
jgi:hypothetical protein